MSGWLLTLSHDKNNSSEFIKLKSVSIKGKLNLSRANPSPVQS